MIMRSSSIERALDIVCRNGMEDLYLLWIKECQVYMNTMFDEIPTDNLQLRKCYPFLQKTNEEESENNSYEMMTNLIGLIGECARS
jgi:hypothetical protein